MILWLMYYIFNLTFFVIFAQFFLRKVKKNSSCWKFISYSLYVFWIAVTRINFLVLRDYSRMWNAWNTWFLYFFSFRKIIVRASFIFFCYSVRDNQRCPWLVWIWQLCHRDYYAVVNFLRLTFQKILLSESLPLYLAVLSPSKMQIFFSNILAMLFHPLSMRN